MTTKRVVKKPATKQKHPKTVAKTVVKKARKSVWLKRLMIGVIVLESAVLIAAMALYAWQHYHPYVLEQVQLQLTGHKKVFQPKTGKILAQEAVQTYSAEQTKSLIHQTNHSFDLPTQPITKQVIRYTSSDEVTDEIPIYGRVYQPADSAGKKLPVLAFAPGTTGIGEACAASLEQPQKRDWANYDSLMAAYASQGYVVVITDYEGMRDPSRLHHYMIGELEGRAVLDSLRAVQNLESSQAVIDRNAYFVGGYSQGGHAAYWADVIAADYAPDLKLQGAIGFGPVTSVSQTLTDAITHNANINWFGPYVLVAYSDWYKHNYPIQRILLPQWSKNLRADALRECVDSVNRFWPNNLGANRSASLYTSEFIAAAKAGLNTNRDFQQLSNDLNQNIIGSVKTSVPKLINQGKYDNVVLPEQNIAARNRLCASGNTVLYREYDRSNAAVQGYNPLGNVDHYQTMNASLSDTLAWMQARIVAETPPTSCQ